MTKHINTMPKFSFIQNGTHMFTVYDRDTGIWLGCGRTKYEAKKDAKERMLNYKFNEGRIK